MPAWMHARAEHIQAKNPDMPKSEAFAIATQQSHALGKSPKSYGTAEGKATAKAKYKTPGDDVKTAAKKKETSTAKHKATVGAAVAGGSLLGNMAAGAHLSNLAADAEDPGLVSKLIADSPIPVEQSGSIAGAHYQAGPRSKTMEFLSRRAKQPVPIEHAVVGANSPASIVAHELGHSDMQRSFLGRMAQNTPTRLLGMSAPLVGLGAGLATGGSDDENVQRAGLAAPALATAPMLASEAGASIHGLRRMARAGASKGKLLKSGLKELLPALASYGSIAGLGTGAAYLGQAAVRDAKDHEQGHTQREKRAMDVVTMSAMADEFAKIALNEKDSGFLGDALNKVKQIASTEVPGMSHIPSIMKPTATIGANAAPKGGPSKGFLDYQAKNRAAGR